MDRRSFSISNLFAAGLVILAAPAAAEVLTPGLEVRPSIFGDADFDIVHIMPGEQGGNFLLVGLGVPTETVEISPIDVTVAWPFAWYQASYGQPFDAEAVETLTPFATNWNEPFSSFSVTVGEPFYLASWAGYNYADPQPNIGPGDPFFWGKFAVEVEGLDATLVLLDSALATGTGIYVGTTVAVPEPSLLAVAGVAAAALAAWRCRRQ